MKFEVENFRPIENTELKGRVLGDWIERNRAWVKYVVPAYLLFFAVIAITGVVYGPGVLVSANFYTSLLTLTLFLAVLGLGQGAVILTGGLDLSVPWLITLAGVLLTGLTHGVNEAATWAVPLVLCAGLAVGVFNGVGVVVLGLPPIVVTLAANGLLQGITLIYCNGSPQGWAPTAISDFTNGRVGPLSLAAWCVPLFLALALLLLHRTAFGRRIYAVGNSQVAAKLSGVRVGATLIAVYCLSGLCSAVVGLLLAGFSSQAFLGMGDPYLLPSIAVVVVGGALITGGRGHYLGVFGGALLLTALGTLLAGTTVPPAVRDIINGLVVLAAVITLRDKKLDRRWSHTMSRRIAVIGSGRIGQRVGDRVQRVRVSRSGFTTPTARCSTARFRLSAAVCWISASTDWSTSRKSGSCRVSRHVNSSRTR